MRFQHVEFFVDAFGQPGLLHHQLHRPDAAVRNCRRLLAHLVMNVRACKHRRLAARSPTFIKATLDFCLLC
jgi:hypothetical protein